MPLEILAIMVVAGVSLIVVAVQLSGLSRPYRLIGEPDVRAAFSRRYVEEEPEEIILAGDGRVAVMRLRSGKTGLIAAFGSRYVCRVFEPGEAEVVSQDGRGGIRLRFREFGFPGANYSFDNAAEARRVAKWLGEENDA